MRTARTVLTRDRARLRQQFDSGGKSAAGVTQVDALELCDDFASVKRYPARRVVEHYEVGLCHCVVALLHVVEEIKPAVCRTTIRLVHEPGVESQGIRTDDAARRKS